MLQLLLLCRGLLTQLLLEALLLLLELLMRLGLFLYLLPQLLHVTVVCTVRVSQAAAAVLAPQVCSNTLLEHLNIPLQLPQLLL